MKRDDAPQDTCRCGDAREHHALGRGACRICRHEYQPLGYPCLRFALKKRTPISDSGLSARLKG